MSCLGEVAAVAPTSRLRLRFSLNGYQPLLWCASGTRTTVFAKIDGAVLECYLREAAFSAWLIPPPDAVARVGLTNNLPVSF